MSTFKRSTRATAQGSSLAPACHLPPTFTNHSTQFHCPRCNRLFSLFREGPKVGILHLTSCALTAIGLVDARDAATAMLLVPLFKLYSHLTKSRPTWVSSTRSTHQSRSMNPHPWRQRTVMATSVLIRSSLLCSSHEEKSSHSNSVRIRQFSSPINYLQSNVEDFCSRSREEKSSNE